MDNNKKNFSPEVLKYLAQISPENYGDYINGDDYSDVEFTHEKYNDAVKNTGSNEPKSYNSKIKSIHRGHRERVRDKFFKHGLDCFSEFEVLEFLLFHTIPLKDTNEIAHRLIERFGSLKGVLNAEYYDLMEVKGISEVSAGLITLQREIFKYLRTNNVVSENLRTADRAGEYCFKYFENHVEETAIIIILDDDRNVLAIDVISKGSETEASLYVRKVIKSIIRCRATKVVVAHNH